MYTEFKLNFNVDSHLKSVPTALNTTSTVIY